MRCCSGSAANSLLEEPMKKLMMSAMFAKAIVLLCGASAMAQDGIEVVANIPFDFTVGQAHLAAGTYYLRTAGERLQVRNAEGVNVAYFATQRDSKLNAYQTTALRFERDHGQIALAGVERADTDYEEQHQTQRRHAHVEAIILTQTKKRTRCIREKPASWPAFSFVRYLLY